jgi:hypothetical protein
VLIRVTLVTLAITLCAGSAHADKTTEQHLYEIGELAIPDVRWEWSKGGSLTDGKLLLSVPLLISLPAVALFERGSDSEEWVCHGHHLWIMPRLLIEPQRQVVNGFNGFWRLLGGVRAVVLQPASGLAVTGEAFGVVGQDLTGVGFGVALGYGGWMALSYRRTFASTGGIRHEVSLDFTLFSVPYGRHMEQVRSAREDSRCLQRWVRDRSFGLIPAPFKGRDESDAEPPIVVHTPCGYRPGDNLVVSVEVFDASSVLEPMVVYWMAGQGQRRASMQRVGETHRFRAVLPTAGARTVSYYVEAFDTLGNGPGLHGSLEEPVVIVSVADPPACR